VVRNLEDGTWFESSYSNPKKGGNIVWEWTLGWHVDGGEIPVVHAQACTMTNPTRGRSVSDPGDIGALKES